MSRSHQDQEALLARIEEIEKAPELRRLTPLIRRAVATAEARKIGSKYLPENWPQSPVAQGVGGSATERCAVAPLHPTNPTTQTTPASSSSTTSQTLPRRRRSKVLQAAVERLVDPTKPWRDLWQHEKLARAFEAAGRRGGLVFTLRFSPDREAFLLQRRDPADDLRRAIARELRAAFGSVPPYGFVFETSPSGALHVHGVVITDADRKTLRAALARAGGRIQGRGAARQVDLGEIEDGYGWAAYAQKAFDTACRFLGTNKVCFISTELSRLARG